jgi:sugar phosphate isomerase/epimerase
MCDNPNSDARKQINAALSTMWGIGRFDNLNDFFRQGTEMGFSMFELNHKVTSQMLAEVEIKNWTIPVIHEPCPADINAQTLKDRDWLISSLDEANRIEGVRMIQRSIDLAHNLGSQAVVIHCGHIPGLREVEDALWALFRAGKSETLEYRVMRDGLLQSRTDKIPPILEAVQNSLAELVEYARPSGVRLGLENRYHISDFPGLDEMDTLLNLFHEKSVGYWYDVGHAHTLDRLGFYPHEAWLQKFGSRIMGVHFHDVKGLDDHFAPGLGEVNWDLVAPYLPKGIQHTLEVQNFNSPQHIKAGMQFLINKRCLNYW